MRSARRQYVLSLPALLGVALVLVYVFGVLNAAGSFTKADIPQSAIRFLSVEQLLVRGISILAQPSVIGLVLIVGVSLVMIDLTIRNTQLPLSPAQRSGVIRRGKFLGWFYLLTLAVLLLFKPWEVGVSLLPMAAMGFLMIVVSKQGKVPHSMPRQLAVAFAASSLVSLLLSAYLLPLPQPTAHFFGSRCNSSDCADGVLITHVDDVWYVWQQMPGEVAVIPDTSSLGATLTYPEANMGDSPAETLIRLL